MSTALDISNKLTALYADGKHEEAAALLAAYEEEISKRENQVAIKEHKQARTRRLAATVAYDVEADSATWLATGVLEHVGMGLSKMHLDTGPAGAKKGEATHPARAFALWMRDAAKKHNVELPDAFIDAFTLDMETKIDDKFLLAKSWVARATNAFEWKRIVTIHGVEKARTMKATMKWLAVHLMPSNTPGVGPSRVAQPEAATEPETPTETPSEPETSVFEPEESAPVVEEGSAS